MREEEGMSDLVEMLQAASRDERLADGMLYRKAADEIERLRRFEQYLNELLAITGESPGEWITNVGAKMYDIKKALDNGYEEGMDESLKDYNKGWRNAQDKYVPEIERLRDEVAELTEDNKKLYNECEDAIVRAEKAADEIERLRRVEKAAVAYVKARDMDRSIIEQLDYHNALKAALEEK